MIAENRLDNDLEKPTVFIVDDDAAMRDSLSKLVTTMKFDSKCFESAEAFLESFDFDSTGCLVLDVRMPGMGGFALHEHLISRHAMIEVIMLTGHGDVSMCAEAMKKGAMDFLEKPWRTGELCSRIQQGVSQAMESRAANCRRRELQRRFASLNHQENTILNEMIAGRRNKEIAEDLDISLRTLQFRRTSIMEKLKVSSRCELLSLANSYSNSIRNAR